MNARLRNSAILMILALILAAPASTLARTDGPDGGGYSYIDSAEAGLSYSFVDIADVSNSIGL